MPTFATPGPVSVVIDLAVGDVSLVAADRTDTVVTVIAADPDNNLSIQAAQAVRADYAAGQLTIRQSMPWYRSYSSSVPSTLVGITVELPSGSQVHGQTALGAYRSQGELGECDLDVSNGDVRLDTVTGALRVRGSNGSVLVRRADADVTVKTSNGSIVIGEVASGVVKLTTSVGAIEVGIRPGTAANIDARAKLGRVRNLLQSIDAPDTQATTYANTVRIRARTNLEGITIRRADQPAS